MHFGTYIYSYMYIQFGTHIYVYNIYIYIYICMCILFPSRSQKRSRCDGALEFSAAKLSAIMANMAIKLFINKLFTFVNE